HIPLRLRLLLLAPAGTEPSVDTQHAPRLLDQAVPGLSTMAGPDQAQIRLWPAPPSQQGFPITFPPHVEPPEQEGPPAHRSLAAVYPDIENLRKAPELQGYMRWVRRQPPTRHKRNRPRKKKI